MSPIRRPDAADLEIIEALRGDPQMTNKAIAARTGISETAVANRIRAMSDEHVMRVVAQRDIYSDGHSLMCFTYIDTSGRSAASIAAEIARIEEATSVSQGIGSPELFVNLRAIDQAHLNHLLHGRIGGMRGVSRIRTEVCLHIVKFISGFGDLSSPLPGPGADTQGSSKDQRIIALLLEDGRMSNREIARRIGVSEGNVRQRLRKMDQANVMRLGVVCDAASLGMGAVAMARIAATPRRLDAVLSALAAIDAIAFLTSTTGEYNITAAIQASDQIELAQLCDDRITAIGGVLELRVHPLIANLKHRYDLVRIT